MDLQVKGRPPVAIPTYSENSSRQFGRGNICSRDESTLGVYGHVMRRDESQNISSDGFDLLMNIMQAQLSRAINDRVE